MSMGCGHPGWRRGGGLPRGCKGMACELKFGYLWLGSEHLGSASELEEGMACCMLRFHNPLLALDA